uniref:Distal membrane-arm assembly complex protein 1-like domain-containing protein n=1 Tax=Anopheles dirus TaxID=7168 RepID=A0A182N502_9DIPT
MTDSVVSNRHKDCMPCRLVSGLGVIGMGVYIARHAQKRPNKFGRYSMLTVAAAAGGIGVARLLDVYPFGEKSP